MGVVREVVTGLELIHLMFNLFIDMLVHISWLDGSHQVWRHVMVRIS